MDKQLTHRLKHCYTFHSQYTRESPGCLQAASLLLAKSLSSLTDNRSEHCQSVALQHTVLYCFLTEYTNLSSTIKYVKIAVAFKAYQSICKLYINLLQITQQKGMRNLYVIETCFSGYSCMITAS